MRSVPKDWSSRLGPKPKSVYVRNLHFVDGKWCSGPVLHNLSNMYFDVTYIEHMYL